MYCEDIGLVRLNYKNIRPSTVKQEWSPLKNNSDGTRNYHKEYYEYLTTRYPIEKDDGALKKVWAKAYRANDILYYHVSAIPLADRVKNWSVSPDSLLTRLEVLADCGKLCKVELLPVIKEYTKHRKWQKEHAKRFGQLLKQIKNKTNTGRYIIQYFDNERKSKSMIEHIDALRRHFYPAYPCKDAITTFDSHIEFKCEMIQYNMGKLDPDDWFWENTPSFRGKRGFYIGPLIHWRECNEKTSEHVKPSEQFAYDINAHGEEISV